MTKNYSCQTNYILYYVVNYININAKATGSGLRVSLTIIEKISKFRYKLETDILNLVSAKTLLLLDRGFYHFSFWLKLRLLHAFGETNPWRSLNPEFSLD